MIAEHQFLAENGADLVELRLDYIGRTVDLSRLLKDRPCPVVVTCRRREDGGRWERSEAERRVLLRAAIADGVDFVDLEEDIAGEIPRYGLTKRIVSYHNFEMTPPDLEQIHARLSKLDPDIVKIATMANSFADTIRMLRLAESSRIPTIALCMGDIGVPTRILGLRFGAPFTYTVVSGGRKIAPGQITFETMRDVYRPQTITERTRLFGVVADPVGHSLSPLIHNAAFHTQGLDCRYLPFRVPPDDLGLFLRWCVDFGIEGLSVTIPHKEAALQYMSEVEAAASGIGAINTIAVRGPNLTGFNTDYRAAMDCLEEGLKTQRTLANLDPVLRDDLFRGRGVLILGAGGVARAIGYGLKQRGAILAISSRTLDRAKQLAADLGARALPWEARYDIKPGVLINCTPIGMHPDVASTPYAQEKLHEDMIVFDTVYNPENTLLVKQARAVGCFVINGLDMFVRQAAYQYKLFTGKEPPVDVMRSTIKRATSPVKF